MKKIKKFSFFLNEEISPEIDQTDQRDQRDNGEIEQTEEKKSETPFLDNFGRDLTQMAEEGKLDPVIGRKKEMMQVEWILMQRKKNNPVIVGEPGVGKAQPLDSLILTTNGWKKMGDMKINDEVITPSGRISKVTGVFPQGEKDIYKISSKDGRIAESCGEHLWKVYGVPESKERLRNWSIMNTYKMIHLLESTNYNLKIPLINNDIFNNRIDENFEINPYVMGILLGDGCIRTNEVNFTTDDNSIYEDVEMEIGDKLVLNKVKTGEKKKTPTYRINMKYDYLLNERTKYNKGDRIHPYLKELDLLNLTNSKSYNKFIPEKYKNSSFKNKISIIQGLLDSNGYVTKTGSIYFYSTSYQLVKDLQYIIWSIGGIAQIKEKNTTYEYNGDKKNGRKIYSLLIRYKYPKDLFRLDKKKNRLSEKYQYSDKLKNNISKIEYVGKKEAQCIMIDDEDHLYITNDFIVTHNTAIVEGIAQQIVDKKASRALWNKRVVSVDMASLVAGAKYRGQFEERMLAMISELEKNPNIIIFIDEIHTIISAGGDSIGAANIMKPALARGQIRCIGATTYNEYRESIEKNGALERRFNMVQVEQSTPEETLEILKQIKEKFEDFHLVRYSDESLEACIKYSGKYLTDKNYPDKAITLMDEAGAKMYLDDSNVPEEVIELEDKIAEIRGLKKKSLVDSDYVNAAKYRDEERKLLDNLKKVKIEHEKDAGESRVEVTAADIAEVLTVKKGIPTEKFDEDEQEKLLNMGTELKLSIVGQDEAVSKITKCIQRNRAGLRNQNRPIGVFLFLGPTGVGKTQLVKSLAKYLFGSEDKIIRVDMSEYQQEHEVARLKGAPPGYVGYGEGGQLTEKVRRNPYSVILLDEIEKANKKVFEVFLQVFDDGIMTDGAGRKVDFKNTIIIMTSNIGSKKISQESDKRPLGFGYKEGPVEVDIKSIVKKELNRTFSPEFLNRLDDVIIFKSLSKESMFKIIDIEVNKLSNFLKSKDMSLTLTDNFKEFLLEKGWDEKMGARYLKRAIQKYIEDPVTTKWLKKEIKDRIVMDYNKENKKILINGEPTELDDDLYEKSITKFSDFKNKKRRRRMIRLLDENDPVDLTLL